MLRVGLLVPPSFANLSFAALAVFDAANLMLGEVYYEQHVVSVSGGSVANSFGMAVQTERAEDVPLDTLLVGAPPDARKPAPDIVEYLQSSCGKTRRVASICVAAFILGEAGLLDGRRSTTHWMFGKELQNRHPKTRVEIDRIFVADGPIWTSAGMAAGIDMALGLVERDIGREKTRETARMMVVHHRRAGGQSQHSVLQEVDGDTDRIQQVLDYAQDNL